MLIAQVESVSVSYGARKILDGLSWSVMDGEKIGLVGPNGAGKSTLLRIMAGLATPDEGERTLRRGAKVVYLPQEFTDDSPRTTVLAEVIGGREDLLAIELELEDVEQAIANPDSAGDMDTFTRLLDRQAELIEQFESSGGPRFRSDAESMLQRLGIPDEMFEKPITLLSGGQRKLVGLARCLVQEPDLLLLDEPDNHLDVTGKERLEKVVRSFSGAVIVISHDRYLLDETISQIVELDQAQLTVYEGNYSAYVKQRELALLRQQQNFVAQQKEIQRLEEAISRFKQWASQVVDKRHIRQAWNKQRMIDRMDKVDRPVLERRKIGLEFQSKLRGGQKIVEARRIARSFGDDIILLDTSFTVMRGDRVGIIGPNGAGKSVLMRAMLGQDLVDDGEVWVGPSVRFGHYAQGHETLDEKLTPIEFVRARHPLRDDQVIANLGRFLFNARQCTEPIRNLSGGEKARLQMVEVMLGGANCLLLDEPTNHLDIESIEVLEGALEQFDGTVIAISHDRYFLDRICTRIFEVRDGDLTQYPGGYSEYARSQEAVGRPV